MPSVSVLSSGTLGLECHLLWRYRTEYGASTLCNFGRLAPGYRTSRNRKTGVRGGLITEGPPVEPDPSLPPLPRRGEPHSSDWMGLDWSEPHPLCRGQVPSSLSGPGLYRLMRDDRRIVYIGQTDSLANRLRTHCLTQRDGPYVSFSVAVLSGSPTLPQRLELEGDLIGGYYETFRSVPDLQFNRRARQ